MYATRGEVPATVTHRISATFTPAGPDENAFTRPAGLRESPWDPLSYSGRHRQRMLGVDPLTRAAAGRLSNSLTYAALRLPAASRAPGGNDIWTGTPYAPPPSLTDPDNFEQHPRQKGCGGAVRLEIDARAPLGVRGLPKGCILAPALRGKPNNGVRSCRQCGTYPVSRAVKPECPAGLPWIDAGVSSKSRALDAGSGQRGRVARGAALVRLSS